MVESHARLDVRHADQVHGLRAIARGGYRVPLQHRPVIPDRLGVADPAEGMMNVDRMTIARARLALREAQGGWLFDPNVTLIGLGWPERKGQLAEDKLAIRFHVRQKLSGFALEAAVEAGKTRQIPPKFGDFDRDVVQATYRPQWWPWWVSRPRRRAANPRAMRAVPMRGGISIGNERHHNYGTLGALVVDRDTPELSMCLSNWHMLVGDWGARLGQRILQPGRKDGGSNADTVATLTRDAMSSNLDAAVAILTGSRQLINDQLGLGPVKGVCRPELGMEVVKSGRETGITHGRIVEIESSATMSFARLTRIIRHIMVIDQRQPSELVSSGGDSGAVWLDRTSMKAVGLHFAGSDFPEQALAMDMTSVLDALNVNIVATP